MNHPNIASSTLTRSLVVGLLGLVPAVLGGCDEKKQGSSGASGGATATSATGTAASSASAPSGGVSLVVAYGSEKKTWLEEQAKAFEASGKKTPSGKPIKIQLKAMGSGEAMQGVLDGTIKPHVFSPASGLYVSLLNDFWMQKPGNTKPIAKAGDPLVLSPIVIAMWKPMAEALGWPAKQPSWADLMKVATDPKGWGTRGAPEWGRFKFAHTHPEFSNSGYQAILAEAYAGAKKQRELTLADLDAKPTQQFIADVEDTVVHYGKSTGFFSDKMLARGPSYLSAAVLYENLVVEADSKNPPMPLVAIYPTEGTFWSDHPYSVIDAPWVGVEEKAAADAFAAFLKDKPAQERALALGFRPADPKIPVGAPIDAAHGVDPKQPQTLLPTPDAKVLEKLLKVWNDNKKGADVLFVFDKSGSMRGKPLEEAKAGAKSFVNALADRDEVTLMFFDNQVYPAIGPNKLQTMRPQTLSRIDMTIADGGTALYDAIAAAYDIALTRSKSNPHQIHAVVVMTDGKDENSKLPLATLKGKFPKEDAPVKVFTIAYGAQAETAILSDIAESARGTSAKGNVDTIKDVYLEMASFF